MKGSIVNSGKKLSVIMPVYNAENYLEDRLTRYFQHNLNDVQTIIVNDGSNDSSQEIIDKHCGNKTDVIIITQENQGLSAARNTGIDAAEGEYILFLDSDDFLLPGSLEIITTILSKEKSDLLFGRYLRWTPETGFLKEREYQYTPPDDKRRRTEYILGELPEPSWNAWRYICRRGLIIECGLRFEVGVLCEDVEWSLALLENAETISYIAKPFYAYCYRRPGSIMNTMDTKRFTDLNTILIRLIQRYKDRPVLCRILVKQSFLYINEYCTFRRDDRRMIHTSYKNIMPLFRSSGSLTHYVAGLCQAPALFYILSLMMYTIKKMRIAITSTVIK